MSTEAHFYADGDLRGMWVLKGTPALVDSTSPRYGEKASYYSAICLETGEVEVLPLEGNTSTATSAAFLQFLRERQGGPLVVIWENASVHGGAPLRAFLRTSNLRLRLGALPAYSPDFNADAHTWSWVHEEVTASTCCGTSATVQDHVDRFFARLAALQAEVMWRGRPELRTGADAVDAAQVSAPQSEDVRKAAQLHVDPVVASLEQHDSIGRRESGRLA